MSIDARPFTGRKMLALLLGFFGLVTAVNGVFIALALGTFPGMTDANPYQNGLAYNRVLDAAESQRALGWRLDLAIDNRDPALLSLRVFDKEQKPVEGLRIAGGLRRPSDKHSDREVALDTIAPGVYQMTMPALPAGNWDAVLDVVRSDGGRYTMEQRVWVKP
jgi:nitrogen fixation protein FixH